MKHFYKIAAMVTLSILFISCSSQVGPTKDEDYAGAWSMSPGEFGGTDIIVMTDTTFTNYIDFPNIGIHPSHKGFISSDPENGTMYVVTTHVFEFTNPDQAYDETLDIDYFVPVDTDGQFMPVDYIDDYNDNEAYSEYLNGLVTRESFSYQVIGGTFYLEGMPLIATDSPE